MLTLKRLATQSETEGSKEYLKLCCAHPLNFGKITPKATLHLTMFPVGPSSWCLVFYSLGVVRLLTQLWAALADLWTLLYSGQETSFKSINYSSALCSILRGGEHHILHETYTRVQFNSEKHEHAHTMVKISTPCAWSKSPTTANKVKKCTDDQQAVWAKCWKNCKKNAILGPRPQTGADCARDQIASLDISKSCRLVLKLVVCWTKYEYDSALERVTGLKQFPLTEPHDRQPGSQICFWTVEVLSLLFFSIVQNFQTSKV